MTNHGDDGHKCLKCGKEVVKWANTVEEAVKNLKDKEKKVTIKE